MFRGERLPPEHPAPDVRIRGVHGVRFEEHRKGRNARRGEEEPRCTVSTDSTEYINVLYLDDSSSNSFLNYSEENSLIRDLRFAIAWTIFGAYLTMNSWKSNVCKIANKY